MTCKRCGKRISKKLANPFCDTCIGRLGPDCLKPDHLMCSDCDKGLHDVAVIFSREMARLGL